MRLVASTALYQLTAHWDHLTVFSPVSLGAINPAFSVFGGAPVITCPVLTEELSLEVEMIFAVMDSPDKPGDGGRAIVLALMPGDEEVGLGAIFTLAP